MLEALWAKKVLQRAAVRDDVQYGLKSGAFMHEKQATVVSFFKPDLEVSHESQHSFSCQDHAHERTEAKESTLVFAVKRTLASVTQRTISYFSESHLCSTATLLCFTVSELIQ